jgi:hypothetical protein
VSTTINYTRSTQPTSDAVDRAWYNDDTKELFLELHGVVYKYSDVPSHIYNDFLDAASKGGFYRSTIRNYGPAIRIGSDFVAKRIDNATVKTVQPIQGTVHVAPLPKLSLNKDVQPKAADGRYEHHFTFTVAGVEGVRKHIVKADGMDAAINELFEVAALFNQDITLKSVTVNFE